ncbi:MAG: conjugal transfer protein TraX [Lachnospiraceae bacterium]|nr:conjugal transfer protein TraX [Lachnospiraceae bacterium]
MNKQGIPQSLNANNLKMIAIIAMTVDHLTWVLFPGYDVRWWVLCLHAIGRITAPVMWFFIAEGAFYTHDKKKYAGRLLLFAFISHFAYNFCFGIPMIPFANGSVFNQTGVIWALFLGLIAIMLYDAPDEKIPQWAKRILLVGICILAFPADWSCIAVLAIVSIFDNRGNFRKQMFAMVMWVCMYAVIYSIFINVVYGILQMAVVLSVPFLTGYNGERGKWKGMKWFFYLYYPLHLILCGILRLLLYGNVSLM